MAPRRPVDGPPDQRRAPGAERPGHPAGLEPLADDSPPGRLGLLRAGALGPGRLAGGSPARSLARDRGAAPAARPEHAVPRSDAPPRDPRRHGASRGADPPLGLGPRRRPPEPGPVGGGSRRALLG